MVGNLTQPLYWKVERALEWVMSGVPSWTYPEVISASFPHRRMAKQQVLKQFMVIYKTKDCVWNCSPKLNHAKWQLCLLHLGKCTNLVATIGQQVLLLSGGMLPITSCECLSFHLTYYARCVGSLLCTERFSPGTPVSPLLKNQHLTWFVLIIHISLQCPSIRVRTFRHFNKVPFLSGIVVFTTIVMA